MKIAYCDVCKKELNQFDLQENTSFEFNLGYGSKRDGFILTFDLCLKCLDDWLDYIEEKIDKNDQTSP